MINFRLFLATTAVVLLAVASNAPIIKFLAGIQSLRTTVHGELADLLVTNGTIYTGDSAFTLVDSMAISDGRVLRVGTFSELKELIGTETRTLDLDGKWVLPGFIDSHVHLISGGLQMARLELAGIRQKDEFVNKVKGAVANMQPGSWLLGGGWNDNLWGGELPRASWIDDITPDNPVWLTRVDGHMGLANSLALKLAGIYNHSPDPDGGFVVRENTGEPTGLLIDSAMKLVLSSIPEVSLEQRREALLRASGYALKRGVTTVADMGRYFPGTSTEHSWEDLSDVYGWADSSGNMKIRVCLFFPIETWKRLSELKEKTGHKLSQWIYLGGVKAFADGSVGSNSALFFEAYADEPSNYGLQVTQMDLLYNMTSSADKAGLQVAIHAIGDRANDLILNMYKSMALQNGIRDRRFRIEHAQHLAPGAATKFGEQDIIASVQPDHMLDDANSAIRKLGDERTNQGSYLFQSILAGNGNLVLGSDWPVVDLNPLKSIRTARRRVPPTWGTPWNPSESISLNDAFKGYTISAARACFLDGDVGSLSPGRMADFVIVSVDSWEDYDAEDSARVEATYVRGVEAYSRSEYP